MTSSDRLLEIVDHLFAAAVGESSWGPALSRLAAVTGSRGAGVQYDHQVRADLAVAELCNLPDDPTPAYLRDVVHRDPRVAHVLANPSAGLVWDYLHSDAETVRRGAYFDWMERAYGTRYSMAAYTRTAGGMGGIHLQRTASEGHVQAEQIEVMRALQPHIARALQLADRLEGQDPRRHAFALLFERATVGIAFLDRTGRIALRNDAGRDILERGDGFRAGTLEPVLSPPAAEVRTAVGHAIAAPSFGAVGGFTVLRPSGAAPYQMLVVGLGRAPPIGGGVNAAAMVVLSDPVHDVPAGDIARLATMLFRLTPAEAALAADLARGLTLGDHADTRRISTKTARWHLKQLFAKTGVRSQSELVQLLNAGAIRAFRLAPPGGSGARDRARAAGPLHLRGDTHQAHASILGPPSNEKGVAVKSRDFAKRSRPHTATGVAVPRATGARQQSHERSHSRPTPCEPKS